MQRALATATIAGALVPITAFAASADETQLAAGVQASQDGTDVDEPLAEDGNDDRGKYGPIGLSGLLGLFGYKKYRDHREANRTAGVGATTTGTTDGPGDGTTGTSRRV